MNDQNQDPEVLEAELMPPENTAIALIAETVTQLANRGSEGKLVIKAREDIVDAAIRASIRTTQPEDYVLFRDKNTGRVTAYLQESGCRRIQALWGVDVLPPKGEKTFQYEKVELGPDFAYQVVGDSYCKLTDTWIRGVEGMRCSTENFISQVKEPLLKDIRVRQAAKASLDGNCIRRHSGMQNIPEQFLNEVWKGSGKSSARCSKGKGFGTSDERRGAQETNHDRPDVPAPICDDCQVEMEYHAAGKSRDGKSSWEAFYRCPKFQWDNATRKANGHSRMKAADWEKTQAQRSAVQEPDQTGTEG